jgi:hypothetical protein
VSVDGKDLFGMSDASGPATARKPSRSDLDALTALIESARA